MNMIPNLDFMKTIINGLKAKIDSIQNKVNNLDADINSKQDLLAGNPGQVVSFDETGKAVAKTLKIPEPDLSSKQDKLTGTDTQLVSFDSNGNAIAIDKPYAATIRVW